MRVSTQEQAKEGYSIPEQTDRLKSYCSAMGWDVFKVYTDAGFSGANTNRPALQELMRDVESHFIEKVVVYKLDRLSRSQKDTLHLIEDVLLSNGCDFVSMNENFDTSTPFGKAMIGILAVFAQLEREQIKERMQMGKDARAKQGLFHGSANNPIGYDYVDGLLKPNPFERVMIEKIFDMYSKGYGYSQIADALNDAGLYHHETSLWRRKVVRHVISSKVYIGMIPHRGQWLEGSHEPLISKELWDRCEALRLQKADNPVRNRGTSSSYLSGLLTCAHCGGKYAKLSKKRQLKSGAKNYTTYICNSRSKRTPELVVDPHCKNKIWKMDELDKLIFDEIEKLAVDEDYFDQTASSGEVKSQSKKPYEEKIAQLDNQISKLMDLYSIGDVPLDILQEKIVNLHQQREKIQEMLVRDNAEQGKSLSKPLALEKVRSFKNIVSNGEYEDVKTMLDFLIDKIELDNENVTIFWNF